MFYKKKKKAKKKNRKLLQHFLMFWKKKFFPFYLAQNSGMYILHLFLCFCLNIDTHIEDITQFLSSKYEFMSKEVGMYRYSPRH